MVVLGALGTAIRHEEEIKGIQIGREEVKLRLYTNESIELLLWFPSASVIHTHPLVYFFRSVMLQAQLWKTCFSTLWSLGSFDRMFSFLSSILSFLPAFSLLLCQLFPIGRRLHWQRSSHALFSVKHPLLCP